MDIMQEILKYEDFMVAQRRYFHAHPEESNYEFKTIEHIASILREMGIPYDNIEGGGILGYIEGSAPGKTVLLRADCDALAVNEYENNLKGPKVCISENPGICHACGHDGHMAALLTAAKVLRENSSDIKGRVILMFERGEEGNNKNAVAIHRYMEDKGIHVDSAYSSHLYSALDTGLIAINDGAVMSGNAQYKIRIKGRGGHGSRPDLSVSPIDCFVAIYNGIDSLRMKNVSPFHPLTSSIGLVNAGNAANVIPDDLTFAGTIRMFDLDDGNRFFEKFMNLVEQTCAAYDCSFTAEVKLGPYSAVINDKECAEAAREAIKKTIGAERVVTCEPWMASESFAFTLNKWPGVFGLVGIANKEKGTGAAHHNGAFDIDEDALKYAAAAYVAYARDFLDSDIDLSERSGIKSFLDIYTESHFPEDQLAYLRHETDDLGF